ARDVGNLQAIIYNDARPAGRTRKVRAVSNTFSADVRVGRSRLPRMKLFASVGSILLCILFATSFLLGQSPMRAAQAAGTIACRDTAGLISAINAANANPLPEGTIIVLSPGCTYQLTGPHNTDEGANGLPSITSPITIDGNRATILRTTTSPTPPFRIFH